MWYNKFEVKYESMGVALARVARDWVPRLGMVQLHDSATVSRSEPSTQPGVVVRIGRERHHGPNLRPCFMANQARVRAEVSLGSATLVRS